MHAIKTKAIVEDPEHLKLANKIDFLKQGVEIDIVIMSAMPNAAANWKQISSEIHTTVTMSLPVLSKRERTAHKFYSTN